MVRPHDERRGALPVIALAMGDPAGISPELTAKLLALPDLCSGARFIIVGDRRVLAQGERVAQVTLDLKTVAAGSNLPDDERRPIFVDLHHLDPKSIKLGVAAVEGGRFALANYRNALTLAHAAQADAVCFTPFNKQAMRLAHPPYDDEISFTAQVIGCDGPASEFNILDELWNARVTSHIPLSQVAQRITREAVLRGIRLTDAAMRAAGFARPRIAVAGLNPHAGDGGNFGHEEIEIVGPCVEEAKAEGIAADGPFSPDTIFVRAKDGAFDAVLTMYHDQGQIAMKLLGFDRGVTLLGGFPFPICTPAHGTAYDIAGKGIANVGATCAAVRLAIAMAKRVERAT